MMGVGIISVLLYGKSTYYDPVYTAPKLEKSKKDLEGNRIYN